MAIELICDQCGIQFVGGPDRKYHDQKCMGLAASARGHSTYKCSSCGIVVEQINYFAKRRKHCDGTCYHAKRYAASRHVYLVHDVYEEGCRFCGETTNDSVFCRRECVDALVNKVKRAVNDKSCAWCGVTFSVSSINYVDQTFHSDECMYASRRNGGPKEVEKVCKNCGDEFKVAWKRRSQVFCDPSCSSSGEHNGMFGRTVDVDPERGQKVSEAHALRAIRGERTESLASHKSGYHMSPKMGDVWYRSSYEQRLYQMLDNDQSVISYAAEPLFIRYQFEGTTKRYVPDVLVEYVDERRELVEVKPAAFLNDPIVMAKAEAGRKFCRMYGWEYKMMTEKELGI